MRHSSSPSPPLPSRFGSRADRVRALATIAIVSTAVLGGTLVRMLPWFQDPALELTSDASYHERLVTQLVIGGKLPSPDALSEAPTGRRLGPLLPTGLYAVAAAACRAVGARDPSPIHAVLLWFTALCGALIAAPVWLAARTLFRGETAARVAAAVSAVLPAHVHRTVCYWLRYDAPGTLLVTAHLAFAFRALDPASPRRRMWALASAAALILAVDVWRVPLMIPLVEAGFVALWVIWRGAEPELREWFTIVIVTGSLAFPCMEYLRAQRFALSAPWLAAAAIAVALWLPVLRPGPRRALRVATLATVAVAGWGAGLRLAPPSPYAGVVGLIELKLRYRLHVGTGAMARPSGLAALLLEVNELYGLTPAALLIGPQQYFALGPWCAAAPILWRWCRRAGITRFQAGSDCAHALFAFMTACLALVTLLIVRNKVLLAPLIAILCAGLFAALAPARPAPARSGALPATRRGSSRTTIDVPARWMRILLALSLISTSICGVLLGGSRRSHLAPGLGECMAWLRANAPAGSVVLAPAEYGYDLQRHAACASLTDGLLESPENQRRILETNAAWFARDDSALIELCRRSRVAYLLIPPGDALYGLAFITAEPFLARLERGIPLERADLERPMMRLMLNQRVHPAFTPKFDRGGFRVFRVSPDAREDAGSGEPPRGPPGL